MSDYRINFNNLINASDIHNLSQMLGIIDNNDKLTIIVDNNTVKDIEAILKLLYENGFDCKTTGGSGNHNLYISASRADRDSFEGIH